MKPFSNVVLIWQAWCKDKIYACDLLFAWFAITQSATQGYASLLADQKIFAGLKSRIALAPVTFGLRIGQTTETSCMS